MCVNRPALAGSGCWFVGVWAAVCSTVVLTSVGPQGILIVDVVPRFASRGEVPSKRGHPVSLHTRVWHARITGGEATHFRAAAVVINHSI